MLQNAFKRWAIALLFLILLLALSACQPQTNNPPAPSQTPAAATKGSGDSSGAAQTPTVVTVTPEQKPLAASVEFGSGPFNLPEPAAGLSNLSSYKAVLKLTFEGTSAGKPNKWSKTYGMVAQKSPAVRQMTIEKSGDLSDLTPVFMAEMNGAAYEARGENSCVASLIEEGNSLSVRREPAGFLPPIRGADEAGSETLNAVSAKHFTFDDRAIGQLKRAKSNGELWVASDGGYILRYKLTTLADAVYFGEGLAGTLTWDYQLMDINSPVTIQLPKDCPDGLIDVPLLPDATNIENDPGSLSFDTPSKMADAITFYQEKILALGWKPNPDLAASDDKSVLISFTQGDRQMTVTMTTNAGVTMVNITTGPQP